MIIVTGTHNIVHVHIHKHCTFIFCNVTELTVELLFFLSIDTILLLYSIVNFTTNC